MRQRAPHRLTAATNSTRVARPTAIRVRNPVVEPAAPQAVGPGLDLSRVPVRNESPIRIQAKLTVGHADDPLEQEADRIADRVMRMPEPRALAQSGLLRHSERATPAPIQTNSVGAGDRAGLEAPPIVHDVLRSPGRPLDTATRAFFEPRFGHDFSQVRVHEDARAAETAIGIRARAYTAGNHIVFGSDQFSLHDPSKRGLLSHELAHVVQQSPKRSGTTGAIAIQRKLVTANGQLITIDLKDIKAGDTIVPVFPSGATAAEKTEVSRIVNAMAKTPTGLAALEHWISLPGKIRLDYTEKKLFDDEGNVEHARSTPYKKEGTTKVTISSAQSKMLLDRYHRLKKDDQFLGAVATHESAHQTDENAAIQSKLAALQKAISKKGGDPKGEKADEAKNLKQGGEVEPVRQELKTLIEYDVLYPKKKGKWRKRAFKNFLTEGIYNATVKEAVAGLVKSGHIKAEQAKEILAAYLVD